MLQEGDQRRRGGDDLLGRDVHVVHLVDGDRVDVVLVTGRTIRPRDRHPILLQGSIGHGNVIIVLVVRGQKLDVLRQSAVLHLAARGDEEAVLVQTGIGGQGRHQPDVRSFGGLDGADAAVVRVVHVARLETGPLPAEAAGPEGGEAASVRHLGKRVGLVHELGQLSGAVELPKCGGDRPDVDQLAAHRRAEVRHRGHALAGDALHAQKPDANLVLQQLPNGAHPPVAQVVDIVALLIQGLHREQLPNDRGEILQGEKAHIRIDIEPQTAVQLITPDPSQSVAPGVEEKGLQILPCVFDTGRLIGTQSAKYLQRRLIRALSDVLFQRQSQGRIDPKHVDTAPASGVEPREGLQGLARNGTPAGHDDVALRVQDVRGGEPPSHLIPKLHEGRLRSEKGDDGIVVLSPKGLEQERNGELLAVVDVDRHDLARGQRKVQPGPAIRDQFRRAGIVAGPLSPVEVNTRGARQLIDDDALGSVDDEGSSLRHHGEIAEKNLLLLDLLGFGVGKADRGPDGTRPGHIPLSRLFLEKIGAVDIITDKFQGKLAIIALDREDLMKQFLQTLHRTGFRSHVVLIEPSIGIPLHLDHIGHFDKIARASEGITLPFFAYRNKFGHGLKDLPCQMGENYAELQ